MPCDTAFGCVVIMPAGDNCCFQLWALSMWKDPVWRLQSHTSRLFSSSDDRMTTNISFSQGYNWPTLDMWKKDARTWLLKLSTSRTLLLSHLISPASPVSPFSLQRIARWRLQREGVVTPSAPWKRIPTFMDANYASIAFQRGRFIHAISFRSSKESIITKRGSLLKLLWSHAKSPNLSSKSFPLQYLVALFPQSITFPGSRSFHILYYFGNHSSS